MFGTGPHMIEVDRPTVKTPAELIANGIASTVVSVTIR